MSAIKEVTQEMQQEIRAHYLRQGATETDLTQSDEGAIVPGQAPKNLEVVWTRWTPGQGFIARCPRCRMQNEFENVSKAGKKTLRFRHCGRADKLPFIFRLLF